MDRRTRTWLFICVHSFAFLSFSFTSSAQVRVPIDSLISPNVPNRFTKNPKELADFLIMGKTSEKEKFDAIFSWVANHIRYNYRQFNSGKGTKQLSVKKILRRRKGICTDYARLMDTLCDYAGIENTSINGYIKEVIFNVNDSLYFDNHTWNAVKLENKWYLYDVTWSSGSNVYQYTRIGIWRKKILKIFNSHLKFKTVILESRTKKDKLCGIPSKTILRSTKIKTLPWVYEVLSRMVNFFPYRMKLKYQFIKNADYYLTEPEVFCLDHFPDDPIWSFSYSIHSLDEFRMDSSFYYGISNQFKTQQREGRTCIECDDFLSLDSLEKEKYLINLGKEKLPQNSFLPAYSEMNVAGIFFGKFLNENDSTMKMALYDSTLNYINLSKRDFKACAPEILSDYRFQTDKNKAKQQQLRIENKKHMKAIRSVFSAINLRQKKMHSLEIKSDLYERSGSTAMRKFNRAFTFKVIPKMKDNKVNSLQLNLQTAKKTSDSLTLKITGMRDSLLNQSLDLWEAINRQEGILEPYEIAYQEDGLMRLFQKYDSYDLIIREARIQIDTLENEFVGNVHDSVLNKADTMYATFINMYKLIKKRNEQSIKAAKLMSTLQSAGKLEKDSVKVFQHIQIEYMKEDICWNRDQRYLFSVLKNNFEAFYYQQKRFFRIISRNGTYENVRFKYFSKHIERNRKRIKSAVESNMNVLKTIRKISGSERTKYLLKLKNK